MDEVLETERALGFLSRHEELTAGRAEDCSLGTAFFTDDFPNKWDQNFVRLRVDDPVRSAEEIAREVDALQGAAGLRHRKIHVPDAKVGALIATGFRRLDWNVTRLLIMVHRGALPPLGDIEVRETPLDELREHWVRVDTTERDFSREESEMLVDSIAATAGATGMRTFAGYLDGTVAGWAELYCHDGIGQVENIATFIAARSRGVASAVVAHCLHEASKQDCDLNFLVADDDDWPKELYARLGYQPAAYTYEFLKKPD